MSFTGNLRESVRMKVTAPVGACDRAVRPFLDVAFALKGRRAALLAGMVLGLPALAGCGEVTFNEFSNLPEKIHWIISSDNTTMTLSDLQYPYFIEARDDGRIVRTLKYMGPINQNDPACAPMPELIKKYNRALVKYQNITTGQAPDRLNLEKILSVNEESDIGQFEYLNSGSLWFLSRRTNMEVHGEGKVPGGANILSGAVKAGTHLSSSTLVAMTGAFKFSLEAPLARCMIAGHATQALKNKFRTFAAEAASRDHTAYAVVYTGAVVGTMISLQLNDVELVQDASFDAGQAIGAKVKAEFSSSNVSINYGQHGRWKEGFTLASFLEQISQKKDPLAALGLLDANTANYAVIGVVPVKMEILP